MRPALPTASSKVTPSDSHPPTIDTGPPTEMISDSSLASVPSSSSRLLASPLLTSGAPPEPSTRRLLSPQTTTRLLLFFFFSSSMMNDVAYSQLLHGGFINFFINYHDCLISKLTDLSASNDVSMIFQGYIEE